MYIAVIALIAKREDIWRDWRTQDSNQEEDSDVDIVDFRKKTCTLYLYLYFNEPNRRTCNRIQLDIKGGAHALIAKRGHLVRLVDTRFYSEGGW